MKGLQQCKYAIVFLKTSRTERALCFGYTGSQLRVYNISSSASKCTPGLDRA